MTTNSEQKTQSERYRQWAARIQRWGLTGLMDALLEAGAPLAPIAGQALYVAQPTLGLFIPRQTITDLAQWLDHPENLKDFRQVLETPPEITTLSDSDSTSDGTNDL